ncbi:hypothetical protein HerbRD11066_71860 [Herbidospora sp. RD11066]
MSGCEFIEFLLGPALRYASGSADGGGMELLMVQVAEIQNFILMGWPSIQRRFGCRTSYYWPFRVG